MSEAERINIYGHFGIAIICTDRTLRSALVVPDYHAGRNGVRARILGRHHVSLEGSGRQHRAGPNDGDGTAAPPLDPSDARRATAIHYLRLLQKHYCQFIYFTLKDDKVVIAEIIFCFYLLSNVVVPEDMLAVDIGTPPIIISVVFFIGIVLKLPAGEILS